ncbi:AMP-dependent synthetase and ligase [Cylindrospermum sp. NIES-4074]|nr:AMP-dependent synthetase and ligase [Cylindrospermum sp. NIES-4074]
MTVYLNTPTKPLCEFQFSNLVDMLRQRAQYQPNQTAFIYLQNGETESSRLTYQELDKQARTIAASLQTLNISGERALLLYPSGLEFIAAFFGCIYAQTVAVPAYPPRRNQNIHRLQGIIEDAQAQVLLTTTSVMENIKANFHQNPELSSIPCIITENLDNNLANTWQEPALFENTLAFLQYTSGSVGMPKGVMISHANLLHNLAQIHKCFGHTPNSQGIIWLPSYHDMGLIGGVLQPIYGGFPVTLMSPVDFLQKPFSWLSAISRYKGTTSGGPNFAYDLCVRKITPEQRASLDLSNWEVAFTGAEFIRAETLEQFAEAFEPCGFRKEAFYPCYGMAETTLIISGGLKSSQPILKYLEAASLEQNRVVTAQNQEANATIVGCGQNLSDQKIVIVDPQSLQQCQPDQVGEIWVSGPSVALGYWNRSEQTQETFHAYLAETGEGPFLRTGDLGFLQDGELFITGRLKDVIIIRGQNHYPQDIELTTQKSDPALRYDCGAAFTVEVNGLERLVIVQEVERSYLRKLNVNAIVGNVRQAVANNHGLQVYAVALIKTGTIPKTSSGKIQRHACRSGFLAGTLNVVDDWSENPQNKAKFLHLQAETQSLLQQVQSSKQSN